MWFGLEKNWSFNCERKKKKVENGDDDNKIDGNNSDFDNDENDNDNDDNYDWISPQK